MTTARTSRASAPAARPDGLIPDASIRLVPSAAGRTDQLLSQDRSPVPPAHRRAVRSWPLLILAIPAAVAVWSGWVGIGQMTGFGQVHPLPGIWDSLHLNTAVTLPVGVEAYAAYALRAWLTTGTAISARTRRFARRSAIGSLTLGMAGQVAYHLLAQTHAHSAPWTVTTAVSCLPVLVLGMGTALAHLLHADAHDTHLIASARSGIPDQAADGSTAPDRLAGPCRAKRLSDAQAAAARLAAGGQRVSRRTLRAAGLHGSNADLGALARTLTYQTADTATATDLALSRPDAPCFRRPDARPPQLLNVTGRHHPSRAAHMRETPYGSFGALVERGAAFRSTHRNGRSVPAHWRSPLSR